MGRFPQDLARGGGQTGEPQRNGRLLEAGRKLPPLDRVTSRAAHAAGRIDPLQRGDGRLALGVAAQLQFVQGRRRAAWRKIQLNRDFLSLFMGGFMPAEPIVCHAIRIEADGQPGLRGRQRPRPRAAARLKMELQQPQPPIASGGVCRDCRPAAPRRPGQPVPTTSDPAAWAREAVIHCCQELLGPNRFRSRKATLAKILASEREAGRLGRQRNALAGMVLRIDSRENARPGQKAAVEMRAQGNVRGRPSSSRIRNSQQADEVIGISQSQQLPGALWRQGRSRIGRLERWRR